MRKNQKYSKEEMYLAIELWQESGLSQSKDQWKISDGFFINPNCPFSSGIGVRFEQEQVSVLLRNLHKANSQAA